MNNIPLLPGGIFFCMLLSCIFRSNVIFAGDGTNVDNYLFLCIFAYRRGGLTVCLKKISL